MKPELVHHENIAYEVMAQTRLEYNDDSENSHKFWEAMVVKRNSAPTGRGPDFGVRTAWGRIGTQGQSKLDPSMTQEEAMREMELLVKSKRMKGYVVTASAATAPKAPAPKIVEVETEWDLT